MAALRILVAGSSGKVGQELKKMIALDPKKFVLAGEISSEQKTAINKQNMDVVIDFSQPELFEKLISECASQQVPLVSGTTGISKTALEALKQVSQKAPMFWAPNMSLGIAVFNKMIEQLKTLQGYDFHIHEVHHNQKKDKPSGTALLLQKTLQATVGKDVAVTAARGGGVFGIHELDAFGPEEILKIEHHALNRAVFARGALQAAQWLVQQPPGLYDMTHLLK